MQEDFNAIFRFVALSDVHYKDEPGPERERFAGAIEKAYEIARRDAGHPLLDALFVVGDFADQGTETQMQAFAETLRMLKPETQAVLSTASHEYNRNSGGPDAAHEKLARIFGQEPDVHKVICDFHCISVSPSTGCNFSEEKRDWAAEELAIAAADDPKKPIFFFQHPHITGTVYGSIHWGEEDLTATLMHYPQVIDFSGHSHAPINDPRSIHQQHFTSLGTGTLSYFELDEFDKAYGTVPPNAENAAQMLIVEADAQNRVRIYPYDLLSGNYFPYVWEVDTPGDPNSFRYTDARYQNAPLPYFTPQAEITASECTANSAVLEFTQASIAADYVNDYTVRVIHRDSNTIVRQTALWSEYYFYEMPKTLRLMVEGLSPDSDYIAEVHARGFWGNRSASPLRAAFRTAENTK